MPHPRKDRARRAIRVAASLAIILGLAPLVGPGFAAGDSADDDGSPDGYPDVTPSEAAALFNSDFPGTVDSLASDPPDLNGEDATYLDNHTAVISPAGTAGSGLADKVSAILARDQGDVEEATQDLDSLAQAAQGSPTDPPTLVSSVLPLRAPDDQGDPKPIDLSLEPDGAAYSPAKPLVDLRLPASIDHDVAIGDQGLRVDVGAHASSGARPIDGGENLFYADALRDTDVVLAPTTPGLEALYELRAPDSPDELRMTLSLPDGANLQATDEGGAKVVRDGQVLTMIPPPAAQDASGASVPVSASVDGSELRLDVPHSDPDIAYPISVDPTIEDVYGWVGGATNFQDWGATQTAGSAYQSQPACSPNGSGGYWCGLWTNAPPGYSYATASAGSSAGWRYSVPHCSPNAASCPGTDAYITNLVFGPINYNRQGGTRDQPHLRFGLWSPSTSAWLWQADVTSDVGGFYWGGPPPGNATTGQQALLRLLAPAGATDTLTNWRTLYLGGATIDLSDPHRPDFTSHDVSGGIQLSQLKDDSGNDVTNWAISNWVDKASATLNTSAVDGGLGIITFQVPTSSGPLATQWNWCNGANSVPCPQSSSTSTSFDTNSLPGGVTYSGVTTSDPVGQFDWRAWILRVDHTPPTITTSGDLDDPLVSDTGPHVLDVTARDGSFSDTSGKKWRSGVRSITVQVNGQQVASTGNHACTQEQGSCPLSLAYALGTFPTSRIDIKVTATDELGHVATKEWQTTADSTPPALQLSGPLVDSPNPRVGDDSEISVDATDAASGVTSVELDVDAEQVDNLAQACPGGGCELAGTLDADLTDLDSGSHTYRIVATDAAGNQSTRSGGFTLDSTPPRLTVTGALADSEDEPLPGPTAGASISATDNDGADSGVAEVRVTVDDRVAWVNSLPCASGCPGSVATSYTYRQSDWGPGPHDVTIFASDAAGNISEDDLEVDLPPDAGSIPTAACPTDLPSVQTEPQVLTTASAQQTITQAGNPLAPTVAPTAPGVDQRTQQSLDPSLIVPGDAPPEALELTGSLAEGTVASLPAGGFQLDRLICIVPTATTSAETPAAIINGDSALYANSAPYSDVVVRPTAAGASVIETRRTSAAPLSYTWKVGIPDGFQLVRVSDGALAVINPNEPAPSDLSVPPAPGTEQSSAAIADVATQLEVESYEVAKAEQDTGHAAYTVITPPYSIDSQGGAHPATLTLTGANTVTASMSSGKALIVTIADNAEKSAAPDPVPSFFIVAKGVQDMKDRAADDAAKFASNEGGSRRRALIFNFGGGRAYSDGTYGAAVNHGVENGGVNARNKDIRRSLWHAAEAYAFVHAGRRAQIVYGNTNKLEDSATKTDAAHIGTRQAKAAHWLATRQTKHGAGIVPGSPYFGERAGVAGDIEMSTQWTGPDVTKEMVNAAKDRWGESNGYLDFGNAAGCPQGGSNDFDCIHGWDLASVGHVSEAGGGRPLPQVYHPEDPDEASQWAHVARVWNDTHGTPYKFHGATGSTEFIQILTPGESWERLRNKAPGTVGRELINYKEDDFGP